MQASLGIAHVTDATISAGELIRNADLTMYKAKAERRGGIAPSTMTCSRRPAGGWICVRTCVRRSTGVS